MSVHVPTRTISGHGLRAAVRRLDIVWPVLLTALVYFVFLGALLASARGNPAIFVQFGRRFLTSTHPPAGAPIVPAKGYDGQLYWLWAHDPLLLHASTIARIAATSPAYSLQRVAYPALAWLLAGGDDGALPWTLLVINLLAVLALTTAFARYAKRRGLCPAWALVVGLAPGLLVATGRDLSDVLATTCMLGGLMCFGGRPRWAALLLSVAALSREPMALAVVAVGVELGWRCVRAAPCWTEVRALLRRFAPAVLLPTLVYLGWRAYIHTLVLPFLHGATARSSADVPILPPFNGLLATAEGAYRGDALPAGLVIPVLVLTLAGVLCSLTLLRRGLTAPIVMAVLYGVVVIPLLIFPDAISLTRYTMPLFLALLLAGVQERSRGALFISAAASATILLLPLSA